MDRREYDRQWYANLTPERKAQKVETQRARRTSIRRVIDEYKGKHTCSCGEGDIRCLEFHHPNPDKEVHVADAIRLGWSLKRIMNEINKCVLLCANCHRKLHYQ